MTPIKTQEPVNAPVEMLKDSRPGESDPKYTPPGLATGPTPGKIPEAGTKPTKLHERDGDALLCYDTGVMNNFDQRLTHIEVQNQQLGKDLRHWDEAWAKQIKEISNTRMSFKAATSNIAALEDRVKRLELQMQQQHSRVIQVEESIIENTTRLVWIQDIILAIMQQFMAMGVRVQQIAAKIQNALAFWGMSE